MIEVPRRRRDCPVPELLGDDPDVHALGAELGRVRVAQAVVTFPRFLYHPLC